MLTPAGAGAEHPLPEEEASPGMKEKTNLTMLCDFYELTMGNGYFQTGLGERIC